jgi:hypothetical protein
MEIIPICISYSSKRGKRGKPYIYCYLRDENYVSRRVMVGRLVLMAFDPRPSYNGLECNHINLDTMNNYLWNLEWTTHRENVQDYYRNIHPESIMPDETVHKICQGLEKSMRFDEIAEYAGLEYNDQIKGYITAVRAGNLRADISSQYNFPEKRRNTAIFTNPEIRRICELICAKYTSAEILVAMGKDYPRGSKERLNILEIIRRIRSKERFTEISDEYFTDPIFVDSNHNLIDGNKPGNRNK